MTTTRFRARPFGLKLAAPQTRLRVAAAFVVMVFAFGGGSRHDIASLVLLRPLACGFLLYALIELREGDLRMVRWPLALLLALAGWLGLQLVPLPPAMWQALPGRDVFAEVFAAAGLELPWLPLTMSPSRTLDAAMALVVPLAGLLLFAGLDRAGRAGLLPLVWGMALLSVVLGAAQLAGGENGPLYFYTITNNGLPVGLFANRNHQALMVCIAILLSGHMIASGGEPLRKAGAVLAVLVCVPFLLIAGSRAGLLLGLAMVAAAALLIHLARRTEGGSWQIMVGCAALLAVLVGVFVAQSRGLALDRLLATGAEGELRIQVWPVLTGMIGQHWRLGTGFGTFEFAFKQAEPLGLLRPSYLNQAHNDWAQWLIEGGLPALAIMLAFIGWLALRTAALKRILLSGREPEALVGLLIMLACAAASLADYPLRVPSLALVFTLACGFVAAANPAPQGQHA